MKLNVFKEKVRKQLWFLNRNERQQLDDVLSTINDQDNEIVNKPIAFSNQFLRKYIFKRQKMTPTQLFLLLILILITYIVLIGLFLFGFLLSLAVVQSLMSSGGNVSMIIVALSFIGSILLIVLSLYFIKQVTAYFTKKLLAYKFNK
ncbi:MULTISPECIES: hypothetical protein [Staphylococcus]|uniref:Staphylococcal protein n=1 Tax=Staphylococcus hsinchuensis TaxID=3051183 RepID=A0ABZ3EDH3_9STAP|nr:MULTISPECIES: hypothetical protein [unclassified Staphylococcus]